MFMTDAQNWHIRRIYIDVKVSDKQIEVYIFSFVRLQCLLLALYLKIKKNKNIRLLFQ